MPKIQILPDILTNKIAAGEVVERPASVVKELLENALDAGADRIAVDVESGGRRLIRVSDNGAGMSRDDAVLAIERYATSKIRSDDDLFAIGTFGFRGEALPSMASVSKFELVSRAADADSGTRVRVDGGRLMGVEETGAAVGTVISVRQLFFNVPVRRKFLKTVGTEMGHIADAVARTALAHPAVRFRLTHNGRTLKEWPAAAPDRRVKDVIAGDAAEAFEAVDGRVGEVHVTGWILPGTQGRSTAKAIHLFVNRRYVRDRTIQHAVVAAYAGRLMTGQYPVAVLHVDVPADRVDVNVHPAKLEVRFADASAVHTAVKRAVAEALRRTDTLDRGRQLHPPMPSEPEDAALGERLPAYDSGAGPISPPPISRGTVRGGMPDRTPRFSQSRLAAHGRFRPAPTGTAAVGETTVTPTTHLWRFADLAVIGQARGTYILCESDEALVVIDQHAAHERIVYERLKRESRGRAQSQRLLTPETVDVGFTEAEAMKQLVPMLGKTGLMMEHFGGSTFLITAVPALLSGAPATAMVMELVDMMTETEISADPEVLLDHCLKRMACHDALRANQALDPREIAALLKALDACNTPTHCPHGRPTFLQWRIDSLEKSFNRLG